MSLTDMKSLLTAARSEGYAVGAFTVWDMESVQAVVGAAEFLNLPVIAQVGPWEADFAGMELLAEIVRHVALRASVTVALHLDHGESFERVMEAIHCGFTSAMIDVSHLPFRENVAATRDVVRCAHAAGVSAEGEIGMVGGGIHAESSREQLPMTDPEEAARFVSETGVDALAVAIGNAHGFYKAAPMLDFQRLAQIRKKLTFLSSSTAAPGFLMKRSAKRSNAASPKSISAQNSSLPSGKDFKTCKPDPTSPTTCPNFSPSHAAGQRNWSSKRPSSSPGDNSFPLRPGSLSHRPAPALGIHRGRMMSPLTGE